MTRASIITTIAFCVLAVVAAWWSVTRYSSFARDPGLAPAYESAIRKTLERGLAGDSTGVARLTEGSEPAAWLSIAMRTDSTLVRAWTDSAEPARVTRSGDTTFVFWGTRHARERCPWYGELTAGFIGTVTAPRLVRLDSHCIPIAPITFDSGSPP
ncbi:MAG: hypothetical protein ABI637_04775 [Gemmatimonadota bacterium]